jgi:hypothetical protein
MTGETGPESVVGWRANAAFTRATLGFDDGSHIVFEHSSRQNRWARASEPGTAAARLFERIAQFRLNGRHLQLFLGDGTNLEFLPVTTDLVAFSREEDDGITMGQA